MMAQAQQAVGSRWRYVAGASAVAFGLATLVEGGQVLFGGPEARAAAGNVVPFVLSFNFAAGFFYLAAGALTLAGRSLARHLATGLAVGTAVILALFLAHAAQGGAFEPRTMVALPVRLAFWVAQAVALRRLLPRTG
jgi:hypothetical protein